MRFTHLLFAAAALAALPATSTLESLRKTLLSLAFDADILLMDEPFGALDALTRGTIQDELLRICAQTPQTVFMITHDVDEAILLADRILLMSNGPQARVAEVVKNTMSRDRQRATLHHDPQYYRIRNHLVDFLVARSKELSHGRAPVLPPEVTPGLDDPDLALPRGDAPASTAATVVPLRSVACRLIWPNRSLRSVSQVTSPWKPTKPASACAISRNLT